MMIRVPARLVAALSLLMATQAFADPEKPYSYEEKPWVESQTLIPPFPRDGDLIEFLVGPTERNRFYVDGSSINIGDDGIVRYVMVLKTSGGASNVTLEALRCSKREIKLVAVGRADGTWDEIKGPQWQPVENKTINHYRAMLSRNFLCPAGTPPRNADEARAALRKGKHPDAP